MKKQFMIFLALAASAYALHAQKPVVSSVSPVTGITGSTVVISGSGFNTTASLNKVWFGATAAVPVSSTGTSLTVSVPSGANYSRITVLNQGSGLQGQHASGYFLPGFSGSAGSVDYLSPVSTMGPLLPKAVASADLDGDGKPDLASIGQSAIALYRNTSVSGSFTASSLSSKSEIAMSTSLSGIAIADIDGDGKQDLIVINSITNKLSVFRNIATAGSLTAASFAPRIDFATDGSPGGITVADFDGDGRPDVAVRNWSSFSVFRNTASGGTISVASFASRVDYPAGSYPAAGLTSCDLDGDNKAEIIVPNYNANTISVFRNTASAGSITASSFASAVDFATGNGPSSAITGDIDGDGRPELIVANQVSQSISILRNTGAAGAVTAGSFAAKADFALGSVPYNVTIADADGDGKGDIVTSHFASNSLSVLLNNANSGSIGASSLSVRSNYLRVNEAYGLYAGDLDGDGRGDLTVTSYTSGMLSVLRSNDIPFINSIAPLSGKVGSTVTITGKGFNAIPSNNKVWFGATAATPVSGSNTSLTVTVPKGATFSNIQVLNTVSRLSSQYTSAFVPTFTNTPGTIDYSKQASFATDPYCYQAIVTDVDGDGASDVIIGLVWNNNFVVYRNIHTGGNISAASFAPPVGFGSMVSPTNLASGDLDGDGKPDVVATFGQASRFYIYRNQSTPGTITSSSFADRIQLRGGARTPLGAEISDLDGDGKPEIILVDEKDSCLVIYRNGVNGTMDSSSFGAPFKFRTGNGPVKCAVGDLDGDKKPDIVVVNEAGQNISIFRNVGNGRFNSTSLAPKIDIYTGIAPMHGVSLADLNADGKPDITLTGDLNDSIFLFRNKYVSGIFDSNAFAPRERISGYRALADVVIGDVDGDAKPDLIVPSWYSMSIFRNISTGGTLNASSFGPRIDIPINNYPTYSATGDIDGDKRVDIVIPSMDWPWFLVLSRDVATATGRMIEDDSTNVLTSADGFTLEQNVPNPFTTHTSISYALSGNAAVTLELYDVTGKRTASLVNAQQEQGTYTVNIDGTGMTSGVYLFVLKVADKVYYKRAVKQ
ncbi:FG-GAP-like repeat-containing protein [Rurimicrobium arvi]|uniref:VCBS repeat-containing protein n=1 Tax=Rurimicrobium arvi TaxID=2049916 RepID=A0ABP8MQE2_9BACT